MIQLSLIVCSIFLTTVIIPKTEAVSCASNPCNLVAGVYDGATGYCCFNVGTTGTDSLCVCPNNIQPVVNGPCRTVTTNQGTCTKNCVNGGVCNIVNGQEVCWCAAGFTGTNCEVQGVPGRCYAGLCQGGTCYEQTIGASTYAYCQCTPGYYGVTCSQNYFTCQTQGVFPDTAQCAIGRYFYCPQVNAAPVAASCPNGQKFNRFTNQCDSAYQCT